MGSLGPNTTAYRAVNEIEAFLLSPDRANESSVATNVLRDLSRQYRSVKPQQYVDVKAIQVRGGATRNWSLHAKNYILD